MNTASLTRGSKSKIQQLPCLYQAVDQWYVSRGQWASCGPRTWGLYFAEISRDIKLIQFPSEIDTNQ